MTPLRPHPVLMFAAVLAIEGAIASPPRSPFTVSRFDRPPEPLPPPKPSVKRSKRSAAAQKRRAQKRHTKGRA